VRAERGTVRVKRAVNRGSSALAVDFKFSSHRSIIHEIEAIIEPARDTLSQHPHRKQSGRLLVLPHSGLPQQTCVTAIPRADDLAGQSSKRASAQQQLRDNIDESTRISTYNDLPVIVSASEDGVPGTDSDEGHLREGVRGVARGTSKLFIHRVAIRVGAPPRDRRQGARHHRKSRATRALARTEVVKLNARLVLNNADTGVDIPDQACHHRPVQVKTGSRTSSRTRTLLSRWPSWRVSSPSRG
jgi:hypothetical protein